MNVSMRDKFRLKIHCLTGVLPPYASIIIRIKQHRCTDYIIKTNCLSSWLTVRTISVLFGSQTARLAARGLAGVSTNCLKELLVLSVCLNPLTIVWAAERTNQLRGFKSIWGVFTQSSAVIQKNLSDLAACMQTYRH